MGIIIVSVAKVKNSIIKFILLKITQCEPDHMGRPTAAAGLRRDSEEQI
jgi:hypothetical protein